MAAFGGQSVPDSGSDTWQPTSVDSRLADYNKYSPLSYGTIQADDDGHDPEVFWSETDNSCSKSLFGGKDWWSVWQGMACLAVIIITAKIYSYRGPPPGPRLWDENIMEAWEGNRFSVFTVMAVVVSLVNTLAYYIIECYKIKTKADRLKKNMGLFLCEYFTSLLFISVVGLCALWLSEQRNVHRYGLTFEVWGLVLGMIFGNIYGSTRCGKMPNWMGKAAAGEEFIKVGLVLLGLDVRTIGDLAGPGLLTSWVVTPIVCIFAYRVIGQKLLCFDEDIRTGRFTKSLGIMLSCGLAVCGSSAATAIHGALPDASAPQKDAELKLTIAIINIFTIFQMIGWPYFAHAVGMKLAVAGAWFGGSIDGTGNVVAAGAILDELVATREGINGDDDLVIAPPLVDNYAAIEIASTVKMIQNSIIGPVTIVVTLYWMSYVEGSKGKSGPVSVASRLQEIWKRFPKFVLGFLIASVVLTLIKQYADESVAKSTEALLIATRSWWFTIGFVAVGMGTNVQDMLQRTKGGKVLLLYILGQLFDLILTYVAAYLSFGVLYAGEFSSGDVE